MSVEEKRPSPSSSSSAIEKGRVLISDGEVREPALASDNSNSEPEINEKKLLRKIDFALIPWLSFLYLIGELHVQTIKLLD